MSLLETELAKAIPILTQAYPDWTWSLVCEGHRVMGVCADLEVIISHKIHNRLYTVICGGRDICICTPIDQDILSGLAHVFGQIVDGTTLRAEENKNE